MKFSKMASVGALLLLSQATALNLRGWVKQNRADGGATLDIVFPVKQNGADVIDKLFWEVSNPKSEMWTQYLTYDQIGNIIKNEDGTEAVLAYLRSLGVHEKDIKTAAHGTFVTATMPISLCSKIFGADFHVYQHPKTQETVVKTESFTMPAALEEHVDHIPHLNYFPRVGVPIKFTDHHLPQHDEPLLPGATPPPRSGVVSPATIAQYYGVNNNVANHGATQSLFAALGQSFSNVDLNSFLRNFGLNPYNITKIIGPNYPNTCKTSPDDCGEANLDVQYMIGTAQSAPTTFWSISNFSNDPFMDWIQVLAKTPNPPQVHSISYGGPEDGEPTSSAKYFAQQTQQLGLQGVTILIASGDDGVANYPAREDPSLCGYVPDFPSGVPYVTAVGATQGPESGDAEIVCSSATGGGITSGGGFSNLFAQPSYQTAQVAKYFNTVRPAPATGYNARGRGYPDVSLLGYNYAIVIGGQLVGVSGTSASSPTFGAFVTLVNDARIAVGKKPLGFLNQAMYGLPTSVWNDVTEGDNTCTASDICCTEGFYAAPGWDPTVGLGTPKFAAFKNALLALP